MGLNPNEDVFEAAIRGIPQVAAAILAAPTEARTRAIAAAAESYRQTARRVGHDEAEAETFVEAAIYFLRAEVDAHEPLEREPTSYNNRRQPVSPAIFARGSLASGMSRRAFNAGVSGHDHPR
jgi:hypothetical protein